MLCDISTKTKGKMKMPRDAHKQVACHAPGGVPALKYSVFILLVFALAVGVRTPSASAAEATCPNEPVRLVQPHGLGLPDCRSYEQVSPVAKNGQNAEGLPGAVQASPSGDAITYYSTGPFIGSSESKPQYISSRGGVPPAWSTVNILPENGAWEAFDEDLSEVVEYSEGNTPEGTPLPAHERYYYLRETATGVNRHIFTVNDKTAHGEELEERLFLAPAGFSADGSRGLFESALPQLPGAVLGKVNLYEYDTETEAITPVGWVPPAGHASCGGGSGVVCEVSSSGSVAGASAIVRHYTKSTISEDGNVVFFTANGEYTVKKEFSSGKIQFSDQFEQGGMNGRIYARIDGDETVAVSEGVAHYRTATPSGEYVFYEEAGNL
jgi:hypothetical protein